MIFCMVSMALPGFLLTSNYTNEIKDICKNIYDEIGIRINETFPDCLLFIDIEGEEDENFSIDNWEFRFNTRNILIYRNLYVKSGRIKKTMEKNTINYNILHLIGLASLFIINVLYIILLENELYALLARLLTEHRDYSQKLYHRNQAECHPL